MLANIFQTHTCNFLFLFRDLFFVFFYFCRKTECEYLYYFKDEMVAALDSRLIVFRSKKLCCGCRIMVSKTYTDQYRSLIARYLFILLTIYLTFDILTSHYVANSSTCMLLLILGVAVEIA